MPETRPIEIAPPEIEAYAREASTAQPPYLEELAQRTHDTLPSPQMLSGPVETRLLEMLVHATRARRVLEIGTYSGYSALAMASALAPGGRIITLEADARHAEFARAAFAGSAWGESIELIEGPAEQTLQSLEGPFELVFIDADKLGYPRYLELTLPLLAPHGLIALDNTLQSGRVLSPQSEQDRAIDALNRRLASDPELVAVLLTVRDGVTLVRRNTNAGLTEGR